MITYTNKQLPHKRVVIKPLLETIYYVNNMFDTIQGEGPFSGRRALFVRMAHCNLQCPQCDTEYTAVQHEVTIFGLLDKISAELTELPKSTIVVFTGGEPLRQSLAPVVDILATICDIEVQIETNGTLPLWSKSRGVFPLWPLWPAEHKPKNITIVCSPKTPKINDELLPYIDCYKYIGKVGFLSHEDGLPTNVLGSGLIPARPPKDYPVSKIYFQAENDGHEKIVDENVKAVRNSCLEYGYRFSDQLHLRLGLE